MDHLEFAISEEPCILEVKKFGIITCWFHQTFLSLMGTNGTNFMESELISCTASKIYIGNKNVSGILSNQMAYF